jgi:hypothetical protein
MTTVCSNPVDALRSSLQDATGRGSAAALVSTLEAASRVVEGALATERVAESAALSLAQRERIAELRSELEDASAALNGAMCADTPALRGISGPAMRSMFRQMLPARKRCAVPPWKDAVADLVATLRDGSERLALLASGQPADAPARVLAEATAGLLLDHHDRTLRACERWMHVR